MNEFDESESRTETNQKEEETYATNQLIQKLKEKWPVLKLEPAPDNIRFRFSTLCNLDLLVNLQQSLLKQHCDDTIYVLSRTNPKNAEYRYICFTPKDSQFDGTKINTWTLQQTTKEENFHIP